MKATSDHTQKAWTARVKAGPYRPVVRATVERSVLRQYAYNTDDAPGGNYDNDRSRRGTFASVVLGGSTDIAEIPHIRSMTWSRSVDQDVAECTIVVQNSSITPLGATSQGPDFDSPGALSERENGAETLWPHIDESWRGRIQPDRLIRTYEGYGVDWSVWPGEDPNLYMSGTWLIDEVTVSPTSGDLTIKCRDVGRVLLDQIAFPPVIPVGEYPLEWSTIRTDHVPGRAPTGGSWQVPAGGGASSSNTYYVGAGIVDKPPYVGANGAVQGHTAQQAMLNLGEGGYYWLSTGQQAATDMVWWETTFKNPRDVAAIRVRTLGGPFQIYVSLYQESTGRWLGKKTIPYQVTTAGVDIEADIKFVGSFRPSRHANYDYVLPRKYKNISKIRLTFTDLRADRGPSMVGYPFRAALDMFGVYAGNYADLGFSSGTVERPVGNITDYSNIVTWILAWGGFYWPPSSNGNYIRTSPYASPTHFTYSQDAYALPTGRVWGTIQDSGTSPIADITADGLDKQPLWESISQARDVLGFVAYVDEAGAFIWRMPNIYKFGNYGPQSPPHRSGLTRTNKVLTIDERSTLLDYEVRTSSANLRERVGVTDTQGKYGAVIAGYRPPNQPTNLRRVALWSDEHFDSNREALVAAELIAARQMMDYRRGKMTIWGNPAIQVDDQIRIVERVTGERFYHYVTGIDCTIDMESGVFEYDIETCWLGQSPDNGEWVIDVTKLNAATQQYLSLLGTDQ
ncbi:hypothetical protein GCM10028801_30610 [Nocardioides maradonensis]